MRKKAKKKAKISLGASGNAVGILISVISELLIQFFLMVVVSFFLLKSERISDSYVMYFYVCTVLPCFIGGFISSKLCTLKGILCGLITAVIHSFILTVILLFICEGHIRPDTGILYAVIAVFAVLGGIAGANTKRRK